MLKKILCTVVIFSIFIGNLARAEYSFPYRNPDIATLTGAIMKSKRKDSWRLYKSLNVSVIEGRNKTYLLEGRGNFNFHFYPQKNKAPLVLLMADFLGSSVSGYMMYMADTLHMAGYNVATISSQFFWNFLVSSSKSGLPGVTSEDAQDMHKVLELVIGKIKAEHKPQIGQIGVIGFGFGGLLAAHISSIEKRENKLNISRYLLVNPIVNALNAITEIETRTAIALDLGMPRVQQIKSKAFAFVMDTFDAKNDVNNPNYFLDLDKKFILSDREYKFLSGAIMRMSFGDTIFASQLIKDLGVLKQPFSRNKRNARQKEADDLGLVGYIKQIFMPEFAKKYKPIDLLKRVNFNYVREDVKNNPNIFLMHNADDILIDRDQLEYLQQVFTPERMKIYPTGGHLGNLWFKQNQDDILNIMSTLK
jgi:hypothetical protein